MQDAVGGDAAEAPVLCRIEGALGRITLNRPAALNAFNSSMCQDVRDALTAWQRDPMVYAIVIDAAGDRAFCAGGDLHEMYALARSDPAAARVNVASEYALNWQIECYTKPIVSLIDGLCMGSGVGLTAFGTHRVAGASYAFAMPETAIGFFPDVGATWLLSQLPDRAGVYLALSGRSIHRADAARFGLVTHCIDGARFDDIRAALRDAHLVDALLDDLAEPGKGQPGSHDWHRIAGLFDASSIAVLFERLKADGSDFAVSLLGELQAKSPTSLAATWHQFTTDVPGDLGSGLRREYRQACHLLGHDDFFEGVRALLIDKDNAPQWSPASVEEVTSEIVLDCFLRPEDGDLELPPRPQAIAAIT